MNDVIYKYPELRKKPIEKGGANEQKLQDSPKVVHRPGFLQIDDNIGEAKNIRYAIEKEAVRDLPKGKKWVTLQK
jgi:hypothetical protein